MFFCLKLDILKTTESTHPDGRERAAQLEETIGGYDKHVAIAPSSNRRAPQPGLPPQHATLPKVLSCAACQYRASHSRRVGRYRSVPGAYSPKEYQPSTLPRTCTRYVSTGHRVAHA
eukprot:2770626-Rhodomonas_salina.3